jgi:hypothetical protein
VDYFIKEGKCRANNKSIEKHLVKNFLHYDFLDDHWHIKDYAYLVIDRIVNKDWARICQSKSEYFKNRKGFEIRTYLEYFLKTHAVFSSYENDDECTFKSDALLAPTLTIKQFVRDANALKRINQQLPNAEIRIARLNNGKDLHENMLLSDEQARFFGFRTFINAEQILTILKDVTTTTSKASLEAKEKYFSILAYCVTNYDNYKDNPLFLTHRDIKFLNLKDCFVSRREKNLKYFSMHDSFDNTKQDIYKSELLRPVATLTKEQMSLVCNLFNIDIIERPSCTGRHIVDDGETKEKIRHFIDLCHQSNDDCVRLGSWKNITILFY